MHPLLPAPPRSRCSLYIMREMYQSFIENGRSLRDTEWQDPLRDPFYDEADDVMIGACPPATGDACPCVLRS